MPTYRVDMTFELTCDDEPLQRAAYSGMLELAADNPVAPSAVVDNNEQLAGLVSADMPSAVSVAMANAIRKGIAAVVPEATVLTRLNVRNEAVG